MVHSHASSWKHELTDMSPVTSLQELVQSLLVLLNGDLTQAAHFGELCPTWQPCNNRHTTDITTPLKVQDYYLIREMKMRPNINHILHSVHHSTQ